MKTKLNILKRACRFWQNIGIDRLLEFQISLFDIRLNKYAPMGVAIFTIDNIQHERSLISILYQPKDRRLWVDICFFSFSWYF
jgi:hypothetical protein